MTFDFDPSDDLANVADGTTPVTVTRPGSSTTCEVTHALRCAVRIREAERYRKREGQYTASDVAWHLPASEMPDAPRPGDVIVDGDGQRWTVLDVQETTLDSRWRCISRNLAVVHGLDQYVDIEKATYTKGQGGAEQPAWRTWKTGLRAKIQPADVQVKDEQERRDTAARFKVYLMEDLEVDHTHRIKGPDGTIYRVTGSRKADRIDALMEIDVARAS